MGGGFEMKRLFYLLNLKVSGIKNIENPLVFDFYKKTINNNFDTDNYKIKAIYGENGSGKTGIVAGVNLLKKLILNRNYLSDNSTQKYLFELVNKKTKHGEIEVEFYSSIDNENFIIKYHIEFEIRDDNRFYLVSERLDRKNGNYSKNQYENVYLTNSGELVKLDVEKEDFESIKKASLNLLEQQTFVGCCFYNFSLTKGLLRLYYNILQLIIFAFNLNTYLDETDDHTSYFLQEELINYGKEKLNKEREFELYQTIKNKLLAVNANDRNVAKTEFDAYEKFVSRLLLFIKIFKTDLCNIEIEKKDNNETSYQCSLKMVYRDYKLDLEFESRGIKKLVQLFNYLDAASGGAIVFIDELDSNINDVYLDKLIEYFAIYGKGQLCFTAHNLSPMSVLKKYKSSICFISSINTVHSWVKRGNLTPENAYRNGFIEDSPFNVDSSDFLGILGEEIDE